MRELSVQIDGLNAIFTKKQSYRQSHIDAVPILSAIADNKNIMQEGFKYFMSTNNLFQFKSVTSDFVIELHTSQNYKLEMGIFSPWPEQPSQVTYTMMHNHLNYALSTVNAFGPGYKTLIFNRDFEYLNDYKVRIKLKRYKLHAPKNIEFVDAYSAHTLFYPEDLTITYALWSNINPDDSFEQQRKEALIRKKIKKYNIDIQLQKIDLTYFIQDHFYPSNGEMYYQPYQIIGENGKHFVQNLFHKLQQIHFDDFTFLKSYINQYSGKERSKLLFWMDYLRRGESIDFDTTEGDLLIPKKNVPIEEFEKCFGNLSDYE